MVSSETAELYSEVGVVMAVALAVATAYQPVRALSIVPCAVVFEEFNVVKAASAAFRVTMAAAAAASRITFSAL